MKLKNLKKFEEFYYFGEENPEEEFTTVPTEEEEECEPCADSEEEVPYNQEEEEEDGYEAEERPWGDESVRLEKFSTFNEKKAKPDFLDLDKDGNKKESMKKAADDAKKGDKKDAKKEDKKEEKKDDKKEESGKGLSAAQKKLPEGLRKAIEKKKK